MKKHKESDIYYALRIEREDSRGPMFAGGNDAGRALFWKWKQAHQFRRALLEHGIKSKVIRVQVTITEL